MPEDDGLFEWPRWVGPAIKKLFRVAGFLVLIGCAFVAVLVAVGVVMNAIAPRRDTTVPAVGVVLVVVAVLGFIVSRMARRS